MSPDPTPVLVSITLGVVGLLIGSFLNVVIHRVPRGGSIVSPPSACPGCGTPIAPRDNIPVLSWLLLRGRCRTCQTRISARYPLVELLNSALWLLLGWWAWSPNGQPWLLPWLLVLGSAGVALWFIDLDHHRLPDAIVLPLLPATVVGLAVAGVLGGSWPITSTLVGLAAWLLLLGGLWLVSGGRAMGFGDVKLAPVLGATLGWVGLSAALVGLLAAFVLGGAVGIVLMLSGKARRGTHLAFGPFLLLGALVGLLVGDPLASAYVGLLGW